MQDDTPPPKTRRERLWEAAEARHVPLRAILTAVAVVALTYVAGKVVYRLRDVILLVVVAGFLALILNPLVLAVQRGRRWIYRPRPRFELQAGDRVISIGPEEGIGELDALARGPAPAYHAGER